MKNLIAILLLCMVTMVSAYADPPPEKMPVIDCVEYLVPTDHFVSTPISFEQATWEVCDVGYSEVIYEPPTESISIYETIECDYPKVNTCSILDGLLGDNGGDLVSIILLLVTTIFGTLFGKLRKKLAAVGELFLKAHEYTDDNQLSPAERTDLINRFFDIIGKNKTGGGT